MRHRYQQKTMHANGHDDYFMSFLYKRDIGLDPTTNYSTSGSSIDLSNRSTSSSISPYFWFESPVTHMMDIFKHGDDNTTASFDVENIDYTNASYINRSVVYDNSNDSMLYDNESYYYDYETLLYRHSLSTGILFCVSYILVFILGVIGNCLTIAVVFRTPRMRTVTNFFIANLAIADVLVIVFCLPATLVASIYNPWMLGWVMCKLVAYVQGVSVSASVNSLVAVSLDRFLAIWFPLKLQITTPRARAIIVIIWIMALTSPIPYFIIFEARIHYPEVPELVVCIEVWPSRNAERLYFLIAHLFLCYLLPLVLIAFCYIMIWIKVSKRDIPGDTRDAAVHQMQQRSKVKVIKMLVVVVIIFMLSWLPLYAIFTRIKLGDELGEREGNALAVITPLAQWLGSSNSCINPILYAFFNKKYRNGFLAIIKSRSCCGTLRHDSYSTSTMRRSCYSSTRSTICYSSSRSTIRPEVGGLVDAVNRQKSITGSVYTLEGRMSSRTPRYHNAARGRSLANGLSPALNLAELGSEKPILQESPGVESSDTIETIDKSEDETLKSEEDSLSTHGNEITTTSFTNGKLEAVD